jgi:hypothetical protein
VLPVAAIFRDRLLDHVEVDGAERRHLAALRPPTTSERDAALILVDGCRRWLEAALHDGGTGHGDLSALAGLARNLPRVMSELEARCLAGVADEVARAAGRSREKTLEQLGTHCREAATAAARGRWSAVGEPAADALAAWGRSHGRPDVVVRGAAVVLAAMPSAA